jgi:hypothetical protein
MEKVKEGREKREILIPEFKIPPFKFHAVETREYLLDVTLSLKAVKKPFTIEKYFLPLYSCGSLVTQSSFPA